MIEMGPVSIARVAVEQHDALQDPWELGMTLAILSASVRPALIVEIGSLHGGSLWAWRMTGAEVIGVTAQEPVEFTSHGARMIWGDSTKLNTQRDLREALNGREPDFMFLDGDHSRASAANDWDLARLLGARVVGFHDIRHHACQGVWAVYGEACRGRRHVEIINESHPIMGTGLVWLDNA